MSLHSAILLFFSSSIVLLAEFAVRDWLDHSDSSFIKNPVCSVKERCVNEAGITHSREGNLLAVTLATLQLVVYNKSF